MIQAAPNLVLEVDALTKVYPKWRRMEQVRAVDEVSFTVRKNETVGLLGVNGAGKTTIIKCICTLIRPTSGRVLIDGTDAHLHPRVALCKIAAVLEGNRNVYWQLTPRENLEFFAGLHGIPPRTSRPFIQHLLELFQLQGKQNARASTLSRGMQQKLAVSCAFVKQTELLLLDEPTLGLDVEASYELRTTLKQLVDSGGPTIILSSHDMQTVEDVCDRVIIVSQGHILVDERVSGLLKLFRLNSYRFRLLDFGESQERELRARFDLRLVGRDADESTIEIALSENDRLHDLVGFVQTTGAVIQGVEHRRPSLDEVFLSLIRTRTQP